MYFLKVYDAFSGGAEMSRNSPDSIYLLVKMGNMWKTQFLDHHSHGLESFCDFVACLKTGSFPPGYTIGLPQG